MDGILAECAAGGLPVPVAAMRVLMDAADEGEAAAMLARAAEACRESDPAAADRLDEAAGLIGADAFAAVKGVLAGVAHDRGASPASWAAAFDRAARASPEAGVALYSLGNPDLLRRATAEIAAWMRSRGLLRADRRALDIGCGIGRFEEALAPDLAHVTGLDVSAGMIAIARERCRSLANVTLAQTSGRDLGLIGDDAMDLVLAVDVFPYLVLSGLAAAHIREAARVLREGGHLLVLNYSYRNDPEADRRDLREAAAASGLALIESGARPFKLWDGSVHLMRRA